MANIEIDHPQVQTPPEVSVTPEVPEIPREIENMGVTTSVAQVPQDPSTQNNPQPAAQDPQIVIDPAQSYTVPAQSMTALEEMEKGQVDDSKTWRATYFIRMVLKAIQAGKQILFGNPN